MLRTRHWLAGALSLALASFGASAQQALGVSKTEIMVGSIQDLSGPISGFGKQAREQLLDYRWPGNVRELENVLRSVSLFCEGPVIRARDLLCYSEIAGSAPGPTSHREEESHQALRRFGPQRFLKRLADSCAHSQSVCSDRR